MKVGYNNILNICITSLGSCGFLILRVLCYDTIVNNLLYGIVPEEVVDL